ncbi:MAG: glycosyltransferase family 4 protein [Chloroflexota bacterium]|nr:glycosyltransferase family 4 protein [Chloroflexota bacterium]MDE2841247.1 glycosyltransferase family 4 protein [Chloroflexota bacterium]MDE2930554.1 glycosyltransferase family 4 protein [Chloroflexota bacterium]
MRVLFLTPQPPWPPHTSPAIRNYQLIAGAATQHQVYVLCFGDASTDLSALNEMCSWAGWVARPHPALSDRVLHLLRSSEPELALRLQSEALAERLRFMLANQRFDLIQFGGLEMAPYLPVAREENPGSVLVLDEHNVGYLLQERLAAASQALGRWYAQDQARRLREYEANALAASDGWLCVSEVDAGFLEPLASGKPHTVIPTGVDPEAHTPQNIPLATSPRLFYAGALDYRPNRDGLQWFCTYVWPLIRAEVPTAELIGIGSGASIRRGRLRQQGIQTLGSLNDSEFSQALGSAWVSVVPLRAGSGMRVKILESFLWGKPVVTTSIGIEGIAATPNEHVRIGDTAEDFAAHVVDLLRDRLLAQEQSHAAKRLAEELYDWRRFTPRLLEFYGSLMEARHAKA